MESGKIKNEALLEAIEVFKAENNQQNLKNFIVETYQNWKSGNLNKNAENIEQFSRKNLTQKLVDLMNKQLF